ncbi:MAG: sigma-54-dependent Fis family transcriptional regulator [Planctomycetaceae bacterium]|nr:sigma-54-dependent Fis family transcriptional regulator [Planctomycetaceae bacterium]
MKILIADDEKAARYGMVKALKGEGRTVLEAEDGRQALQLIREAVPDLVFLDLNMPETDGMTVLQELQIDRSVSVPEIIVVTANDTVSHAVRCIHCGAADFLTKPYDVEHIRSIARRTEQRVALQARVAELEASASGRFGSLIGADRQMQHLFRQIMRTAAAPLPVLIRGESGTGKELVAREIHQRSKRGDGPFVAVNTAAIAESLAESELFGHVKGAFTGADRSREGVFRQAHGGTLFLDEIGDMPSAVQTRLLRVLQEGVLQPVGSAESIAVDVRIISATHQPLEEAIAARTFRQDLYFRLKGIELFLPPLRSRPSDILLLADQFLRQSDGSDWSLSPEAVSAMLNHAWPGNVRELQQMIQAAVALHEGEDFVIRPSDLALHRNPHPDSGGQFDTYLNLPLTEARNRLVEDFEREAIRQALDAEAGNISAAARRLQIHRQNLQQKIRQLDIQ